MAEAQHGGSPACYGGLSTACWMCIIATSTKQCATISNKATWRANGAAALAAPEELRAPGHNEVRRGGERCLRPCASSWVPFEGKPSHTRSKVQGVTFDTGGTNIYTRQTSDTTIVRQVVPLIGERSTYRFHLIIHNQTSVKYRYRIHFNAKYSHDYLYQSNDASSETPCSWPYRCAFLSLAALVPSVPNVQTDKIVHVSAPPRPISCPHD